MNSNDQAACLGLAEEVARWAVAYVAELPVGRQAFTTKENPADLVTATDRAIEAHVRSAIAERFPGHRVVGEEEGADGHAVDAPTWYVDPVDGTTNFAHGLPNHCFSLAVAADGRTTGGPGGDAATADADAPYLAGVVADLTTGSTVSAVRGGGTRRDGAPVTVAGVTDLAGEVVLTELLGHVPWPGQSEFLEAMAARSCATRVLGSTALSLAYVASGRAAATVLGGYQTWDVAAGLLLAREAGAVVLSPAGPHDGVPRDGMVVATPGIADAVHAAWTATRR